MRRAPQSQHGAGDFENCEHLRRWLGSHRVDLSSWGHERGSKSVDDLYAELEAEESVLCVDREGVVRLVAVAKVRVVRPDGKELHFEGAKGI